MWIQHSKTRTWSNGVQKDADWIQSAAVCLYREFHEYNSFRKWPDWSFNLQDCAQKHSKFYVTNSLFKSSTHTFTWMMFLLTVLSLKTFYAAFYLIYLVFEGAFNQFNMLNSYSWVRLDDVVANMTNIYVIRINLVLSKGWQDQRVILDFSGKPEKLHLCLVL